MTLRYLRIFEAVCRHMSITRAAQELYLSQPSVSLAIGELEKKYEVRLFDRIGKKLYLTPAGEELLGYARPLLSQIDDMEQHLRSGARKSILRVGVSMTVGSCLLPACAEQFAGDYPDIRVEALVERTSLIEQKVLENELDIGFVEGLPKAPQLIISPFAEDELAVVCAPDSALLRRGAIRCADLASIPLLLREKGSGTRAVVDNLTDMQGVTLKPLWESMSTLALISGAKRGLGAAILPLRIVQKDLDRGELAILPVEDVQWKRQFFRIQHRNKILDEPAEHWARLMAACAAGELPDPD
ncbi:MAG TPA: LysR family transcriptional regulator [Candidatus Merdivicinus faecavium]|nr:LysR family transcriptional regulator [Candidatus Merdivicinus faecavium]